MKKNKSKKVTEQVTQQEEIALLKRIILKKDYLIQSLEHQLQLNRTKDLLTDSYTKQHLTLKFREAVNMQRRWGFKISLCYFDVNAMSELNKTYGTDYGDSILMSFGKLAKFLIRDDLDSLYRIGGDDFIVILIDCNHRESDKICKRISKEFTKITEGSTISYSIAEVKNTQELALEDYLSLLKRELEFKYVN